MQHTIEEQRLLTRIVRQAAPDKLDQFGLDSLLNGLTERGKRQLYATPVSRVPLVRNEPRVAQPGELCSDQAAANLEEFGQIERKGNLADRYQMDDPGSPRSQ